jgi:hypothetical protein
MGLMNKLKGIFMEEVIVEEDDEEEINREKEKNKEKEKVQVAKKIENPTPIHEEPKEVEEVISLEESNEMGKEEDETKEFNRPLDSVTDNDYKFPMQFDDRDFEMDEPKIDVPIQEPEEIKPVEPEPIEVPKEEPMLYHERRVDREVAYDYSVAEVKKEPYENDESKKGFQRSPIISPVYGILDKNYKKDDVVSKKEIRLTTNNKKADLDLVREKAYGDLANDITESIHEEVEFTSNEEPAKEEKDSLLYDLSEDASPSVKDVTVGDAEEYFNDLGLEYNVDYKVEKEEPSIKNEDKVEEKTKIEEKPELPPVSEKEDDELFDLIDAMYDNK